MRNIINYHKIVTYSYTTSFLIILATVTLIEYYKVEQRYNYHQPWHEIEVDACVECPNGLKDIVHAY